MPPLSGTLGADFSPFVTECAKADAALAEMQAEASKTQTSLDAMTTTTEAGFSKLSASSTTTTQGLNTFTTGLRTADKALSSMGVNIGPQIGALEELAQASGKSAAELGKLGTAMAGLAAFTGGFKFGRMIAEFLGTDKAVVSLTDKIFNLKVAQEEQGAKQDVINRAIANGAAATISYTDAIEFNRKAADAHAETFNTGAQRLKGWQTELDRLATSGVLGTVRQELTDQTSTVEQLAKHYKVQASTLEYLQRVMKDEATAARESSEAEKKRAAEVQKVAEAQELLAAAEAGYQATLATMNPALVEQATHLLSVSGNASAVATALGLTKPQVEAVTEAVKAQNEALELSKKVLAETGEMWRTYESETAGRLETTNEAQRRSLQEWLDEKIRVANEAGITDKAYFDALGALYDERLAAIGTNWQTLKDGTIAQQNETLANHQRTLDAMLAAQGTYTPAAIAKQQEIVDAFKRQMAEQTDINAKYYAEIDAMMKTAAETGAAAARSQAEGVEARWKAAGEGIEAGWARVGIATDNATAKTNQYSISLQQAASSAELLARAATAELDAAANRQRGGGGAFWSNADVARNQEAEARFYRDQAAKAQQRESYVASAVAAPSTQWGGNRSLTVNVNNADAQGIANKLVTEMRYQGVRF